MSTSDLPPERRSEIARNAALARKGGGKRGFPPCHAPDDPTCKRCRQRASEQRSRAKRKVDSGVRMATTATMSGLQFDTLPYDEGRHRELLEGDCIEVSSPTPRHQEIIFRVQLSLRQYLAGNGTALAAVEFALSDLIRLRPDVCVLLADRARLLDLDTIPIPGAPDLAVEVISPTERASESQDKVRAYLRNGTREVWQIFPRSRTVSVHTPTGRIVLEPGSAMTSALLPGCLEWIDQLFAGL